MIKCSLFTFLLFLTITLFALDKDFFAKAQTAIDSSTELISAETIVTNGYAGMPFQKAKAKVTTYFKKGDKYRVDVILPNGTRETRSFDGINSYQYSSKSGNIKKLKGLENDAVVLVAKLQNPEIKAWENSIFSSVIQDKREKQYIKLICQLNEHFCFNMPVNLYLDKKSYLIKKIDLPISMFGKELLQNIEIKNYKKKGGSLFAENMSSSIFGAVINYHLNTITLNQKISDSFFTNLSK